jgi:hypothetical protein
LPHGQGHVLAALLDAVLALQRAHDHRHGLLGALLGIEVAVGQHLQRIGDAIDHRGRLARGFVELTCKFLQRHEWPAPVLVGHPI